MRTLYLECNMGISSEMLLGALLELKPSKHVFLKELSSIGLPGVTVKWQSAERCGVWGSQVVVLVNGRKEGIPDYSSPMYVKRPYYSYLEVISLITRLSIPKQIQEDSIDVFTIIAKALSDTENVPVERVPLYEAGSISSITTVIGCCILLNQLKISRIVSSPIRVGSGKIRKYNGIYPVPTPAVSQILKDIPHHKGDICAELCTLTGAAIAKHFVHDFSGMPVMQVEKTGCGIGELDFHIPHCLRVYLGNIAYRPSLDSMIGFYCEIEKHIPDFPNDNSYYDYIMKEILISLKEV